MCSLPWLTQGISSMMPPGNGETLMCISDGLPARSLKTLYCASWLRAAIPGVSVVPSKRFPFFAHYASPRGTSFGRMK